MVQTLNKLGDRMLARLLPRTEAAAQDCICCPGGQHSVKCTVDDTLYQLGCCCDWQFVCDNCC